MQTAVVSIDTALRKLRQVRRPNVWQALAGLRGLRRSAEYLRIVRAYDPELAEDVAGEGLLQCEHDAYGSTRIEQAVMLVINNLFPVGWDMDLEFEDADESGGEVCLRIENVGFPWDNWDDWEMAYQGLIYHDEDEGDPDRGSSLLVFARTLLDATWDDRIGEYYGWPQMGDGPDLSRKNFDWGGFVRRLEAYALPGGRNLSLFQRPFEIAAYCTGNIFYDLNRYDEVQGYRDPDHPEWYEIPFTLESVRRLEHDWEQALAINAEYQDVEAWAREEPEILRTVFTLFCDSLVEPEPRPARTLAEIWAAEDAQTLEEI